MPSANDHSYPPAQSLAIEQETSRVSQIAFLKMGESVEPVNFAGSYLNSLAHRDSTKSITLPSRFALSSRSISCTPVGLVTFTSVR